MFILGWAFTAAALVFAGLKLDNEVVMGIGAFMCLAGCLFN